MPAGARGLPGDGAAASGAEAIGAGASTLETAKSAERGGVRVFLVDDDAGIGR